MKAFFKKRLFLLICVLAAPACDSSPDDNALTNVEKRSALLAEVKRSVQSMEEADMAQALTGMEHRDSRVRERAVKRLAELAVEASQATDASRTPDTSKAKDAFVKALKDESKRVRIAAATALGQIRDTSAIDPLIFALADSDPAVRLWVGKALRRFGDEGIAKLISCMAFDSAFVDASYRDLAGETVPIRRIAKELLASIGKPVVPLLIQALTKEKNEGILHNVSGVLGKIGPDAKDALPALIAAFNTTDVEMRVNVVSDIGKIGDLHPDVVPLLKNAVMDPDPKVAAAARQALRTVNKGPANRRISKPEQVENPDVF
jgi:HEAT repeat protein